LTAPLVSAVMITYGGDRWIRPAVDALAANTEAAYELIIVDNASGQSTRAVLRSLRGAKVIFNERNVGFGPGANQGVLHAAGRFICILNSDAFVEPGWLPPLVETLEHDPLAGAAVPCLLHLDGRLQEAGGVVGCDGSTRALGDGDDPQALAYRFRRYVDYGSAACLLMRRSIFAQIGGFDPAYPMGYCEDVDLCFALQELGLRTVYEPRSKVRHVRWGSSSRLEAERRVFANQPILLARWRERLAGRPSFAQPPFPAHDVLQARDAEALDRILIVTDSAWGWPGPPPERIRELAAEIVRSWPDSRVTMAIGEPQAHSALAGSLLHDGIELAAEQDWSGWFEARRYHYSAVLVCGPAAFERFDPLICATQPQAMRIFDLERLSHLWAQHLRAWWPSGETGPAAALEGRLTSLEAWGVESAGLILCATPEALAFARGHAPATPAVLVGHPYHRGGPPDGSGEVLGEVEAMQVVGELPPGPRFGGFGGYGGSGGRELQGPLRQILEEMREPAGEPRYPPPARRGQVRIIPPPNVARDPHHLIADGVPFVTWPGAAEGLDLGTLESVLVAGDASSFARLAGALLADSALWESVHSALLHLAARRDDPGGMRRDLWTALAHCGMGCPVGSPREAGNQSSPDRPGAAASSLVPS
jgi:GT2 family glycosyltransferase